jgi:hypothetical protein
MGEYDRISTSPVGAVTRMQMCWPAIKGTLIRSACARRKVNMSVRGDTCCMETIDADSHCGCSMLGYVLCATTLPLGKTRAHGSACDSRHKKICLGGTIMEDE